MTTLSAMKTRIATEMRRSQSEFTAQVGPAIATAIAELEAKRFYFNESRDFTFDTVNGQEIYTASDSPYIGRILKFDYVTLTVGASVYCLDQEGPERLEWLSQSGYSNGQPHCFSYYNEEIRLYPIPSDAWTVRIAGKIQVPAPASDDEADNPWMTKAEKLVRCWAKYELYEHVIQNPIKAAQYSPENEASPTAQALSTLKARTNDLTQQGGWAIQPTLF